MFFARYRSLSNHCALCLFQSSNYVLTVDILLKKPSSVLVVRAIGTCSLMRMKTDHKCDILLVNKTLCERIFGRGRTTGMIL